MSRKAYERRDENIVDSPGFVRNKSMIHTFDNALTGIINAIRSERNMKIHLISAILVLLVSVTLKVSKIELAILSICIVLVFMAEIFNTAIEELTDMVTRGRYSKFAKKAKDYSAGAVFITAIMSIFVGFLILYPKLKRFVQTGDTGFASLLGSKSHVTFIAVALVLMLTIALKGIFYKKNTTHFQGGTVSGHSALAFCLATVGAMLSGVFAHVILYYMLALLVAEARVEARIHTVREIILGAILGTGVTYIIFTLFG